MGENLHMNIESIPTGALALDMALGIGGLPRGRIVELYGPESSGSQPWPCTWSPKRNATADLRLH